MSLESQQECSRNREVGSKGPEYGATLGWPAPVGDAVLPCR